MLYITIWKFFALQFSTDYAETGDQVRAFNIVHKADYK